MPIYEFKCLRCGEPAEVLQHVGDRAPACPACGSKRMTRAVSRTSFHLKGGGWYADLYASQRPGAAKVEGAEPPKASDEKPAAKPEPAGKPDAAGKPPATPPTTPASSPAPKAVAPPREASRPPRSRPGTSRKRG